MPASPATVILENQTQYDVRFFTFREVSDPPQTNKVTKGGGKTTISVTAPDTYLFGAWFDGAGAPPQPPSLFPTNTNPHVTTGDVEEGKTYKVVLTGGGISFALE